MKTVFVFCLILIANVLNAQTPNADAKTPPPAATQTNVVVEKDGKLYVQTTTVAQVEASSELVLARIEKLEEQKAKIIEEQIKNLDKSILELKSLHFELLKKEKKLKKDEKSGQ